MARVRKSEPWSHVFRLITPILGAAVLLLVNGIRDDIKDVRADVRSLVPVVATHGARIDALEKRK